MILWRRVVVAEVSAAGKRRKLTAERGTCFATSALDQRTLQRARRRQVVGGDDREPPRGGRAQSRREEVEHRVDSRGARTRGALCKSDPAASSLRGDEGRGGGGRDKERARPVRGDAYGVESPGDGRDGGERDERREYPVSRLRLMGYAFVFGRPRPRAGMEDLNRRTPLSSLRRGYRRLTGAGWDGGGSGENTGIFKSN
eukprot:tig00000402_g253.t1